MPDFPGFHDSDFDAYAPNKWASNVYNLERLRVKEKLEALATVLSQTIEFDPPLCWELSSEHPALWNNHKVESQDLYFLRTEDERKRLFSHVSKRRKLGNLLQEPSPFLEHLHLAIKVTHEGLDVSMALMPEATLDHDNLIHKLEDPWQRSEMVSLLSDLPERFDRQLAGRSMTDPQELVSLLAETKVNPEGRTPVLCLCDNLEKSDPVLEGPQSFDRLLSDLQALMPLFRFIQWTKDNDHLLITEELRKTETEQKKKGIASGDKVRITDGLWAGKVGEVTGMDSRGQAKVLVGKMTVQVKAEDLIKMD